ncbi:hypothetical protein V7158_01985 [Priestia megaterium]
MGVSGGYKKGAFDQIYIFHQISSGSAAPFNISPFATFQAEG